MEREGFRFGGMAGDLFLGTAADYDRHRLPYPAPVVDSLIEVGGLDGTGRLLDVGCGTGQVFGPLGKYFREVVAIDPSDEMLEVARRKIAERRMMNVELRRLKAEEISSGLGTFRMAIFGASFHWTDRERVAELVYDRLEADGVMVVISYPGVNTENTEWSEAIRKVVEKYLGPERRAGSGVYVRGELHEDALGRTRFAGNIEARVVMVEEFWTVERIVGWLFSSSFASRAILGNQARDFEAEVREVLGLYCSGKGADRGIGRSVKYSLIAGVRKSL